jgi:exopolyphosphatase/guanosine-5'-triphosphate,3'-diphosphate pyrophosphatase
LTEGFFEGRSVQVGLDAARAHLADALGSMPMVGNATEVIGTSGTIESVQTVLAANGWGDDRITGEGMDRLVRALFEGRWDNETGMLGLAPERVDIFPAGVALLDMVFRQCGIGVMRYVGAALEDGVLDEMVHCPVPGTDPRELTVRGLQSDFRVDPGQAARVQATALACFEAVAGVWSLDGDAPTSDWRGLLLNAAALHEIGLGVGPRGHQRHAAYLLRHVDLVGFSRREQDALTGLVRSHRRVMPGLSFNEFAPEDRRMLRRLTALLRLAVILERGRADGSAPQIAGVQYAGQAAAPGAALASQAVLQAGWDQGGDWLRLTLPAGWSTTHALSAAELELEVAQLATAGIGFEVVAS